MTQDDLNDIDNVAVVKGVHSDLATQLQSQQHSLITNHYFHLICSRPGFASLFQILFPSSNDPTVLGLWL